MTDLIYSYPGVKTMEQWKKTSCVLCGNNCGLELLIENNRIEKIRPDKSNPLSQGYVCRKGLNVAYHQHHADRINYPLKKVGDSFERISWDQALEEIAEKLKSIIGEHGPRSFAYMGGLSLGCRFEGAFGKPVMKGLGSQYMYNALAQELTGKYWVDGKVFGKQYLNTKPYLEESDMLLAIGWNPMMSHHIPRSRPVMTEFGKNPDKLLVVIDPRRSETARVADMHLPIRPGTDALLLRAMISIILKEGWEDADFLHRHVSGFEAMKPLFIDFDAATAIRVCELDYNEVWEVSRLFASRKSCLRSDLGLLMTRHSTLISYLEEALLTICGRVGQPGGNIFPLGLFGPGSHSDENDPETWRTITTNFPAICGLYPPNAMPEEIISDSPDRLRAIIVSSCNPLRSFADTTAFENAFQQLELLVSIELAMTETARLANYILPSRTGYEGYGGVFHKTYPKIFFQMRKPVIEPEGEQVEVGQIYTMLADKLGLIPDVPDTVIQSAENGDRDKFATALKEYLQSNPEAKGKASLIVAKTLGKKLGSGNLAWLWWLLQSMSKSSQDKAARTGFTPGPGMGEELFQSVLDHPEGIWIGENDDTTNLEALGTDDGRINLNVPELEDWIKNIDPDLEQKKLAPGTEYPFILSAGRHLDDNANTSMRNPEWNRGRRVCTVAMHPQDAGRLSLIDSQMVVVATEAGEISIEAEITNTIRPGHVIIPHGFGLVHQGKTFGANVNRLTKNTHRDRIAGTPLHRYVPCRITPMKEGPL